MDPAWLGSPPGSPFRELEGKPSNQYSTMVPPPEPSYTVNTHFHPLNDGAATAALRNHLRFTPTARHTQNQPPRRRSPSVGLLLASFFRYYAYEFDYKRHIV